ncbi:type II toxin-antitoxin system RelE/ParE family toxin [Enterovirga aerilata]|uniref:Type II toxin-antitoxin system RelE/ParE family toxin n=1 Tax=Enterovirga aerilata TaxID=2730920 RepID=A0A849IAZ7_9HYPH|nr:type II toxin-antitoxin system RelE/ParE family toxin [Enterovirga sp. DB1703]
MPPSGRSFAAPPLELLSAIPARRSRHRRHCSLHRRTLGLVSGRSLYRRLHQAFETVARFPEIGRRIDQIRPGYFRFEHASHSIFYRIVPDGVLIVRVLHARMMPQGRL